VPVFCNVLWSDREDALRAPRGDLHLTFCPECGHLYNRAFDPSLLAYEQTYENSLHFSPRFQGYVEALAARLVTQHGLEGVNVVEIGSGQGDFLRLLAQLGNNRGVGFDPSYVPEPSDDLQSDRVTFVQDYFSPRHPLARAGFYVARHVLEHLPQPAAFLQDLRQALGPDQDARFYLEVPNALYTLRDGGIWDLIYEHYSYFSAASITHLLERCGYEVLQAAECFGTQFLGVEARLARDGADRGMVNRPEAVAALRPLVEDFSQSYRAKVSQWREAFEQFAPEGRRAVVWGVGSKGVTFLNLLPSAGIVEHVIDINPRKQGMYVAGTGQRICPPDDLRSLDPEVVIVMNPLYEEEIRGILAAQGLAPRLMVA
jgi:SAM-dependent methyltransferase